MRKIFFVSSVRDVEQNKNIMNLKRFLSIISKLGMDDVISPEKAQSYFDDATRAYDQKNIDFVEFKVIIEEIAQNVYSEVSNDNLEIIHYFFEKHLICNEQK